MNNQDLKRINDTLDTLRGIWFRFPELRLGQLIENARTRTGETPDLFYITNEDLVKKLREFAAESDSNNGRCIK